MTMSMSSISEFSDSIKAILAEVGRKESLPENGFIKISRVIESYTQSYKLKNNISGFVRAAEDLRDFSFPNWILAGLSCDSAKLDQLTENYERGMAMAIGRYLTAAMSESNSETKIGAKRIDQYLMKSGLYPNDVYE